MTTVEKAITDDEDQGEYAIIPPNGGWGWVVVCSAFYCNLVTDGIQLTFGVFLKEIAEYFDVEKSKVSLVGSLMFGMHLLVGPICSGLSSVLGIRPISVTGAFLAAFGLSISYFSPSYEFLYFSYGIIGGTGLGLIYMNSLVITSLYFTSYRVLAVAIVVCGTGCGTIVFAFIGNELLKVMDWQTSFLIEGGLACSMVIAALTFRPLKPKNVVFTDVDFLTAGGSVISKQSRISQTSKLSKFSRFSKTSKFSFLTDRPESDSIASNKSGKTIIYIRRTSRSGSNISIRTLAIEKLTHQAILQELEAQGCCRCECCPRNQTIVFNTQDKKRKFTEYVDTPRPQDETTSLGHTDYGSYYTIYSMATRKRTHSCCDCTKLKKIILAMLDFKLLLSYAFVLFCLSGSCSVASMLIVLIYEKDRAVVHHGYSDDTATYLIVSLGAANMFWRLFLGIFSTSVHVNVTIVSIILSLIAAGGLLLSTLWDNLFFQFVCNIVFAIGMASFAVFRPVLLIELVGPDLVLNATGITLLFMGVICMIFPPFTGLIMEITHDFNAMNYMAGLLLALSGVMLIKIHKVREKDLKRLQRHTQS